MHAQLLSADNLQLTRRDKLLFSGLSFSIRTGEVWHLRGDNGQGKSSLLDLLVGLNSPDSGVVTWYQKHASSTSNNTGKSPQALKPTAAREVGLFHYCRQQNAVNPRLTIRENTQRQALWAKTSLSEAKLEDWAAEVNLLALLDEPAGMLSQGQQKQIALARLRLFPYAPLWILDEPFNSLDRMAVARLEGWIEAHLQQQGAVLFVSHSEQCQSLGVKTLSLSASGE